MGKISTAVVNDTLDELFGAGANNIAPATYYIGLSTTAPTDTGSNITEPSGNAYARVAVTNNSTNFPAASARAKSNGTVITFPTATGSWGTVSHFVVMDASTAGNMVAWGALTSSQAIATGATPDFPVGALSITAPGT